MSVSEAISDEFFARAVHAKYDALAVSMRHVSLTLIYFEASRPHILQEDHKEEPCDYYSAGGDLVRRIDRFLESYNKIMTPKEAEAADVELDAIIKCLDDYREFVAGAADTFDMDLFIFKPLDEQVRMIADLPLVRLRDFLLMRYGEKDTPIYEVHATVKPASEEAVRKAVNEAMLGIWATDAPAPLL